jgi:serine phosphatase RsbU (regulator of sigma subunit)/putative methionine-R-sulfoxide reductase with GAF domain
MPSVSSYYSIAFAVLLIAFIVLAYIFWRRFQSRSRLVRRVAELEALSDAGRAIAAAQLDVRALCRLIAEEAGKVIDNRTFQIGLFDGSFYQIQFWTINDVPQNTPRTFNLEENSGVVGWVRSSKQPLLVHDFQKELNTLPARPRYISDHPPRSAVFIPLISGDKVIGIVAAQSSQPNRFSAQDMGRLMILANQASAGIDNAFLFDRERKRAAQMELVGQVARQVIAINDLEELFSQIVELIRKTFGFHSVNIFVIDENSGEAVVEASNLPELEPGVLRMAPDYGIIGTAVSTRTSIVSNDTRSDERFVSGGVSADTRSEVAVPLIVDNTLLGVLDVQSYEIGTFAPQEQMVIEALAAQVAIAIHKARQFAAQREQAWVTTAQLQVAETIGQNAELDSLATAITRLTPMLVGVDQCALLVWDSDMEQYWPVAAYGASDEIEARFNKARLGIGDWKALDAAHVGKVLMKTSQQPPWLLSANGRMPGQTGIETVLLPLVAKGRNLGMMVVTSYEGENESKTTTRSVMGNGREELLRNIANQTAQGIESILLHDAQQEEAWVNTALLQVAEAVNKLTDLNEILYTIVRMVPMLVGVKVCLVLIWDEEQKMYRAGPSFGLTEMEQGLIQSFDLDPSEFPSIRTQDIERAGPDVTYHTLKLPPWLANMMGADTVTAFPLYARARLVGILVVGPPGSGQMLSGRRLNILTGIAQQAAIAVVNDHLYKESAERSRIEQELDVARAIQASLMPESAPIIPRCTVASYWEAARQVSGDFYDFLELPNGSWGIAIADVADKGVPAALFMALSRTILRTVAFNRVRPSEVLERSNTLIYGDTSSDLFVTVFYAIWEPETRILEYANGGHNPPLLIRADGKSRELTTKGIALGVIEEVKISHKKVKLHPGDTVIFYTDGVTEAMNEDFDEFGTDRLSMVAKNMRNRSAVEIVSGITQAVDEHAGDTSQFDDVTLVVMKAE